MLSKMRKCGWANSDDLKNWANSMVGLDSAKTPHLLPSSWREDTLLNVRMDFSERKI